MAMPLTVTVLPVPAFWSLKVADVSLKVSVSPDTTWLLERADRGRRRAVVDLVLAAGSDRQAQLVDVGRGGGRAGDQAVVGRVGAAADGDAAHRDRLARPSVLVAEGGRRVAEAERIAGYHLAAGKPDRSRRRAVVDLVLAAGSRPSGPTG